VAVTRQQPFPAREIANARLVELPGADHDPWVGDSGVVGAEVEAFIATLRTACAVAQA
jgi:pimeloyl-ACP methyl ester carboxylesterase